MEAENLVLEANIGFQTTATHVERFRTYIEESYKEIRFLVCDL